MWRSLDAVVRDVLSLLPIGRAWVRDRGTELQKLFTVLAQAIWRVEAQTVDLKWELNPATASKLLDGFERVLGPDPCGLDDLSASLAVRQLQAWRRWTRKGGQSAAYFIALAASYGFTITITTYRPVVCGDELGASPLIESPEQFVWTIRLALVWERPAICGDQVCGDFLGEIGLSPVECLIRRYAPAHTIPVFDYSGA